jgi:hypothetical protein
MTKPSLPWGVRFELTEFAQTAAAFKGRRVTIVDGDQIPRRVTGELTSCPHCYTFPCSCEAP